MGWVVQFFFQNFFKFIQSSANEILEKNQVPIKGIIFQIFFTYMGFNIKTFLKPQFTRLAQYQSFYRLFCMSFLDKFNYEKESVLYSFDHIFSN